ncbi:MAG: TonB family protein [Saprospiraceae bacterium]|nr:TonB family protein [Saprospiraceae bacterium]MBP9210005.1 TonB family protein [Saprospiraceae bacterium]
MKKDKKKKDFLPAPEYPGGPAAMRLFIASQLRYPETARAVGLEGTVVIKGEIDYRGKVIRTQVISSLSPECDLEAQRVVNLLNFNVAKIQKLRVRYYKTFQINFRAPRQSEMVLRYDVKATDAKSPAQPKTFHYSIPWPPVSKPPTGED